jgi:hypothetical protein
MPGSVDLKRPLLAVASLKTYSPPPPFASSTLPRRPRWQ